MRFHNFTLPEERCVRLLVKNLGRGMPKRVLRVEVLDIHVQAVKHLRSGLRYQNPAKERPLILHFIVSVARVLRCPGCVQSANPLVCGCWWSRTWLQRVPFNANADSASDTLNVIADTRPGVSRVVAPTSPVGAQPRAYSFSAVAAGATTPRVTGDVLVERREGSPCKVNARRCPDERRH